MLCVSLCLYVSLHSTVYLVPRALKTLRVVLKRSRLCFVGTGPTTPTSPESDMITVTNVVIFSASGSEYIHMKRHGVSFLFNEMIMASYICQHGELWRHKNVCCGKKQHTPLWRIFILWRNISKSINDRATSRPTTSRPGYVFSIR